MKFLDYIGEFLLFRWLFGKLHNKEDHDKIPKSTHRQSFMNDGIGNRNSSAGRSINSYHEHTSYNSYEGDSYEEDDEDYEYYGDDWDSHSYNDFHDHQDDYDLTDDF